MANNPPVAMLTVDKAVITLPENKVTASLAGSHDIDKDGDAVDRTLEYSFSAPGTITQNGISAEIVLPEGTHTITGTVTDRRGAKGSATATVTVKAAIVVPPPPAGQSYWGIWGNGDNVTQKKINDFAGLIDGNGWRPRFDMATFWPAKTTFNRTYITDQLEVLRKNGLKAICMIYLGDNMPAWQFKAGASKTAQDGVFATVVTDRGVYPYYQDPDYEIYAKQGWTEFLKILDEYKDVVLAFMPTVGSTGDIGDRGGYKSEPKDSQYEITREWWDTFTKKMWMWAHDNYSGAIAMNPGNSGEYMDYIVANMPKVKYIKQGNFSHEINKDGDRAQALRVSKYPEYVYFGETEGYTYSQQQMTAITLQCSYVGLSIQNVAADKAGYGGLKFGNDYLGTDKMFWYPHCAIELTGLSAADKGAWKSNGFTDDDFGTNIITEPYARGIEVVGGSFGVHDAAGGMFGMHNWFGTGTVKLERPATIVRIWYKDGNGTMQLGSKIVKGANTGKELFADFTYSPGAVEIKTTLLVYLIEGK